MKKDKEMQDFQDQFETEHNTEKHNFSYVDVSDCQVLDENNEPVLKKEKTSAKGKTMNKIIVMVYEKLGFFVDDYEKQEFINEIEHDFSDEVYKPNRFDKMVDGFTSSRIGLMLMPIITRYIIYFCMKLDFMSMEDKQKQEIKEKLFEEI